MKDLLLSQEAYPPYRRRDASVADKGRVVAGFEGVWAALVVEAKGHLLCPSGPHYENRLQVLFLP